MTTTAKCRKCRRTIHPSDDGRFGKVDWSTVWVTQRRSKGRLIENPECREGGAHDAAEIKA